MVQRGELLVRTVLPPSNLRAAAAQDGDRYTGKLVKYVPAETMAFFIPVAAQIGTDRDPLLVGALVVAAIVNVCYLWQQAPKGDPPRPHFYVLADVAFVAWALATSGTVMHLFRVDQTTAGVILGGAVFLIPLADGFLNDVMRR